MSRIPGCQRRSVMEEKAKIARILLSRGLTISQVSIQLNCSRAFIRQIARDVERELQAISA